MVNRLSQETSPYLLQHQNDPVDWYLWGDEALEKSRHEPKPIFLSIGCSACLTQAVAELTRAFDFQHGHLLEMVTLNLDRMALPATTGGSH